VQLPGYVRRHIEERAQAVGFAALERAASALSQGYRDGRAAKLTDEERVAAYLVTRMPATYAVAHSVLREWPWPEPQGVLDIGAGSGAASLAARELFPGSAITMIERDPAIAGSARAWLPDAEIVIADAKNSDPLPTADLVIAAYSLGELGRRFATRLWQAARVALAVIEPGTPEGFALVRDVRDQLLAQGARMIAPCPVETACPVAAPDWCHFAARVERSSIHRRIKHADLGYEDEKFSYVMLAREAAPLPSARVIRRPRQRPGLIVLETCSAAGLRTEQVARRDREDFRNARHVHWGGRWRGTRGVS
jgi:ribosomal protein RSM22 (predicted rRNA methylase)